MLDTLTRYRRDLHRIPEIMFDLPKTRAYILAALRDSRAIIEETEKGGITAFFDNGYGRALAFRADMDALSITEETGVDFASQHPGRMHACGHDGHMAMLLAFCRWLEDHQSEAACDVLAVFQPAEESGGGAEHIARSDLFSRRNVTAVYAFHVDPMLPEGVVAARRGEAMAQASEVTVTVRGKASHVAQWQGGVDSMEAAAHLYLDLYEMERSIPQDTLRLLKFGKCVSGTAPNIISDLTRFSGSMRAFRPEVSAWMKERLYALCRACEERFGVRVEVDMTDGYPPVINDPALFEKTQAVLADMGFVSLENPEMIAEDFAFYQTVVPGVMMKLGVGCGVRLHSEKLMFDEKPLLRGVEAFIRLARAG